MNHERLPRRFPELRDLTMLSFLTLTPARLWQMSSAAREAICRESRTVRWNSLAGC